MATSTNLIRTLTIRSKTEGVQESANQLQGLASAGDQVTTSSVNQEKATLSVERAYQRLQRQLDQTFKSQEQMAKIAQTLERAQAQGLATQERSNELMAAAAQQYGKTASAMSDMTKRMSESTMANDKLVRGMSEVGKAAKAANDNMKQSGGATDEFTKRNQLARYELINLSRQIQDVGVSLASGQNFFTVAIQQGSQIADVFQTSGVTAAGFGKQLLGMISPMVALVGGITLAVAAITLMAKAWSEMAIQADNLSKRLNTPIAQLQELQGAAAIKGISTDDFVKGMESFGDQLSLAQRGLGDLKELFRLNGMAVEQDMLPNFLKVSDLVRNARTEVDKLNILQAAGLPRTQDWVRLMEQGGDAVRKAAQEMGHANVSQDMVDSARKFNEAWDKAWSSFKTGAFAAIGEVLELLGKLATAGKSFLDAAGGVVKGVLGSAKTRADELAAGGSIEDQLIGPQRPPLQLTVRPAKPTITPEDLKAMEQEISLQKQRISLLGELATSQEKAELARKEINVARLKGVEISKGEGDAIVKNIELDLKHGAKLKELKEDYHQVEQAVSTFGTTLITSMLDGATATEALGKALEGLGKQLISIGMQDFAKSISKSLSSGIDSIVGGIAGTAAGSIAGPLGTAAVGVGVSLLGKLFGGSKGDDSQQKQLEAEQKRAAEALQRAKDAWAGMTDQVEAFNRMAAGVKIGDLTSKIDALFKAWEPLKEAAKAANDAAGSAALGVTLIAGIDRLLNKFAKDLPSMIGEFGASGPIAEAGKSVQALMDQFESLNDSIHEFSSRTLSDQTQAYADLNAAARKALMAMLDVPEALSDTAKNLADINGKAAALQDALVELGMSAEEAAAAIQEKLNVAIEKLRSDFLGDLARQVTELAGGEWINQAIDLAKKVAQMRSDAAMLGVETNLIDEFYVRSAQKIVDENKLTGDSFERLEAQLGLAGTSLHAFSEAIEEVAAVAKRTTAEIASTIQGYRDQLFVLQQNQDTLPGALAVFDRNALRQREDEIAKGGEALADLTALQEAQKLNIIADFHKRELDEQKRAQDASIKAAQQAADQQARIMKEAQTFLEGALRRVQDWIAHFQASAQSQLPPSGQLSAAQAAFTAQRQQALTGNRDALTGITGYAQDVVDAVRRYYGSGAAGQTIVDQMIAQLQALPTQVSAEQFIVNGITDSISDQTDTLNDTFGDLNGAVTAALAGQPAALGAILADEFNSIDLNLDGLLDHNELETALGKSYATGTLKAIDTNGDDMISRAEVINASLGGSGTSVPGTKISSIETGINGTTGNLGSVASNTGTIKGDTSSTATNTGPLKDPATASGTLASVSAKLGPSGDSYPSRIWASVYDGANTAAEYLHNVRDLIGSPDGSSSLAGSNQATRLMMQAQNSNWGTSGYTVPSGSPNAAIQVFAKGGLVTGFGSGTSDSILARISNGEYIVNAAATARNLSTLDAMNYGGAANDNGVVGAIERQTAVLMSGIAALIQAELQAAGIISSPIEEANKLQRSRRGEKKKAA